VEGGNLLWAGLAFPDDQDLPAEFLEGLDVSAVAVAVAGALGLPEFDIGRRRNAPIAAVVHVPITAVDEDDLLEARKNQVGLAGEVFAVQAIAVAEAMDERADEQFGFRVFAAYAGHI